MHLLAQVQIGRNENSFRVIVTKLPRILNYFPAEKHSRFWSTNTSILHIAGKSTLSFCPALCPGGQWLSSLDLHQQDSLLRVEVG